MCGRALVRFQREREAGCAIDNGVSLGRHSDIGRPPKKLARGFEPGEEAVICCGKINKEFLAARQRTWAPMNRAIRPRSWFRVCSPALPWLDD
jgi:hypothetical protein